MADHVVQQEFERDKRQRCRCQAGRKPDVAPFLGRQFQARATGDAVAAHAALTLE
jgi:hypothetical protein